MKKLLILVFLSGLAPLLLFSQEGRSVESLSPELRTLMKTEMAYIEVSMKDILSNIVKGEYEQAGKTAGSIRDSFVFAKSLTQKQVDELKANLPQGFREIDQKFHQEAGALAVAGEFGERDEALESYSKMLKMCVQCHSTYVTHRFDFPQE